jgi:hypothetical protein
MLNAYFPGGKTFMEGMSHSSFENVFQFNLGKLFLHFDNFVTTEEKLNSRAHLLVNFFNRTCCIDIFPCVVMQGRFTAMHLGYFSVFAMSLRFGMRVVSLAISRVGCIALTMSAHARYSDSLPCSKWRGTFYC